MKRGRLPLTALRSFEAAGRLESFTLAAQELFVSQAAVSRQIRDLELFLAKPLFERRHRAVVLTRAGAALLAVLTQSFDRIDVALEELALPEQAAITVNSEPSFAGCWLVPHLSDFRHLHPEIDVTVESDARLIEFRARDADLAIRHSPSETGWPRVQARHLLASRASPMVAPALMAGGSPIREPRDLLDHVLLHEENRDLWERWFAAAGIREHASQRGPIFADGALVMQAALRGHGVAMLDSVLAGEELKAGRLVQPFPLSLENGAYWLVCRDFDQLGDAAGAFAAWLQAGVQPSMPL